MPSVENAAKKGAEEATAKLTVNQEDEKKEKMQTEEKQAEEKTEKIENKKPQTAEEYIKEAPAEIRPALNGMLDNYKSVKASLIKQITTNEKNSFTKEELEEKELPELKKLAALISSKEDNSAVLNYDGLGDVEDITDNKVEPLIPPAVINAEPKK